MNKFLTSLASFSFWIFSLYILSSQSFKGTVFSSTDSLALPFANIYIKGTTKGTVTNLDGNFTLYYHDKNDTIAISFVGSKSVELPIHEAIKKKIFYLEEENILKEIVVTKIRNGKTVFQKAVDNLVNNYRLNPSVIKGYLKEVATQNKQIKRMIEAAVEIHNPSYIWDSISANEKNQMKLLNVKTDIDKLYPFRPAGSINSITNRIFIDKNLKFISANWDDYTFELSEKTIYEKIEVYIIDFKSNTSFLVIGLNDVEAYYSGRAYVSTDSYAIVYLEYREKYLNSIKKGVLKRKSGSIKYSNKVIQATNEIRFKPYNERWLMHFARKKVDLKTNIIERDAYGGNPRKKNYYFSIEDTFISTEVTVDDVYPFDEDEVIDTSLPLSKQLALSNEELWNHFNAIPYTKKELVFLRKHK